MVRAVICCWQYNCLAVLSFSQRRVGEKGTKNQNHNKRGQRVSAQITINSSVCWRRAPSYSNHKKKCPQKHQSTEPQVWWWGHSTGRNVLSLHLAGHPKGCSGQQQFTPSTWQTQWKQGWGFKPHPEHITALPVSYQHSKASFFHS